MYAALHAPGATFRCRLNEKCPVNSGGFFADKLPVSSPANAPLPPDHATVIGRALCLSSLVVRGTLESATALAFSPDDAAAYHELAQRLSRWLNDQEFTAHFTADELDALSAPPGAWTPTQHELQSERVEAVGVLFWALSLQEKFPGYHEAFALPDLQPLLGWPADAVMVPQSEKLAGFPYNGSNLLQGITQLRPVESLRAQRSAADCWQWRTNIAAVQRVQPTPPPGHDYGILIGIAAEEAHAAGAIARPVQNDFPLIGKPFAKAPAELQARCAQLVASRHLALDWLCGYATVWDAVSECVVA